MDWRRREGGGVVDYGRMRLSRRKISKRSLLLFLLLFRIGVWVDLMGFLSSWAEIICPLAFWLSRAESVILFSVPYGYSAKLLSKRGKSVLLDFPGKKRSSFFFPQFSTTQVSPWFRASGVGRGKIATHLFFPWYFFPFKTEFSLNFSLFHSLPFPGTSLSSRVTGNFLRGWAPGKGGGEENRLERLESLTHTKKGGERRKI